VLTAKRAFATPPALPVNHSHFHVPTRRHRAHGTTDQLAKGLSIEKSAGIAKDYVTRALARGVDIGEGHGPVEHFAGCRLL
jgi:hydroxymethylpyrimidine/phosphomethylpyrimidine kinase